LEIAVEPWLSRSDPLCRNIIILLLRDGRGHVLSLFEEDKLLGEIPRIVMTEIVDSFLFRGGIPIRLDAALGDDGFFVPFA